LSAYQFDWSVILHYREALLTALAIAVRMAAAALALGLCLGLAVAYLAQARSSVARRSATGYVAVVRNTPLLVLVFIIYLVLPQYGIRGLDATTTFIVALSIVASGYIAENFRAAFATIPSGYRDGARAIGLTAFQREIHVVLPITFRYALPALTNSAVAVFKDTSIASIIAIHELTYVAREITTNTFLVFEAWASVALIYLAISSLLALAARAFERRLSRLS
jgi:His/Glu/Gln/Arg/opine family amino acid ABC transporter permease subunit